MTCVIKIALRCLFISAFFLGIFGVVFAEDGCAGIEITEIMFDPAGSDTDREWIELFNSTDHDISIDSHWRIFDGSNHTISVGTGVIIHGGEYIIISSEPSVFGSEYSGLAGTVLKSALSLNNTGERVEVRYDAIMCSGVDYTVPQGTESGFTYEKKESGWGIGGILGGTPMREYEASSGGDGGDEIADTNETGVPPQQTSAQKTTEWQLNNLVHFNEIYFSDNGSWIELLNGSTSTINLNGWVLRAGANEYMINDIDFSNTILKNGEYFLIPAEISGIRKNTKNSVIELFNNKNELVENINYGAYKEGQTYGIIDERWKWYENPTRGTKNSLKALATDISVLDKIQLIEKYKTIKITEIFPNPKGSDDVEWFEIYNSGDVDVSLDGLFVDDMEGGSKPFSLFGTTLGANEYFVIKKEDSKINFNNTDDEARILFGEDTVITNIVYTGAKEDHSYAFISGEWVWTADYTQGEENPTKYIDDKVLDKTENKNVSAESENSFQGEIMINAPVSGDGSICVDGVVTLPYGTIWKTKMFTLLDDESVIEGRVSKKVTNKVVAGDNVFLCGISKKQNDAEYISIDLIEVKTSGKLEHEKILVDDIDNVSTGAPVRVEGALKSLSKKSFTLANTDGSKTIKITGENLSFDKKDFLKGQPIDVSGILIRQGSSEYIYVYTQSDIKQGVVVRADSEDGDVLIAADKEKNTELNLESGDTQQKKRSLMGAIAPWGLAAALGGYLVRLRFFV